MNKLRVVWVNETADSTGGCERYIRETAAQLALHYGVHSTLLYRNACQGVAPGVRESFLGGVFPLVALKEQLVALQPDIVYVHRLVDESLANAIGQACQELQIPALRFFHDHKLFCPREHKYTVLGRNTCTQTVGLGCYACGGVVNKYERGFRLTLPQTLLAQQASTRRTYTGFVVGSRYMASHLQAHGFATESLHILPLYAERPTKPPVPLTARHSHQLVFAGQLGAMGKGLDTLLQALAKTTTPAQLSIYGSGKFEADYRALAAQLQIESRVTWCGKTSSAALEDVFRHAAAVVVPSRSPETFGLVGPEAMRFATPVIATTVGGMGEWLQDGVTGLAVPSNDPEALAAAIDRLLSDATLQATLGQNGYEHYFERFTPECHMNSLHTLLRKLS
jgi:glycosyltransferase involved in cell wall biosynthesis